jgi:streptogramin lyase
MLLAFVGCTPSPTSSGGAVPSLNVDAIRSADTPTFQVFTAGRTHGFPSSAVPIDIIAGPSGTLWFTDLNTPAIGRITSGATFHEFTTGLKSGAQPYAIVLGPDGNLWFTDESGAIGRITPTGSMTEFTSARFKAAIPANITVGSDGALWTVAVGAPSSSKTLPSFVVRVTVDGKMSWSRIPLDFIPDGSIQADSGGNLWFFASRPNHDVVLLERTSAGKLVANATGLVTKGEPCCPNISPNHIAIGPDGNPWFTTPYFGLSSKYAQLVGTFASGKPTLFDIARHGISYPVYPSSIVRLRHYLWFSGSDPIGTNGALWRLDSKGKQIAYPIPYNPTTLVATGNVALWFTSQVQGRPPQIVEASLP